MVIEEPPKCKVFYCDQIEAQVLSRKASQSSAQQYDEVDLKLVDSAVMDFESKKKLKRYGREELLELKLSNTTEMSPKTSQNITRLDINRRSKPDDREEGNEEKFKALRDLLPSLSQGSWDPNLMKLLNNYHRSLLYPRENLSFKDYNERLPSRSQDSQGRRVSWSDQKQHLDHLPSYNNRNFFDNITTTTTMKPPRMGVGSLGYQKNPQHQFFRSAKVNSCSNEHRQAFYPNSSVSTADSFSMNETKSSYEGFLDRTTSDKSDHNTSKMTSKTDDSELDLENEPEWFSFPASRHDVIDLHGFEEDEAEQNMNNSVFTDDNVRQSNSHNESKLTFDNFPRNRQEQKHASPHFNRRSNYNSQNRFDMDHVQKNNEFYNRYRHNMDQSNSSSSFNSSGGYRDPNCHKPQIAINPFFEMWRQQLASRENFNYGQMPQGSRGGMMTIADVENALKNGMCLNPQQVAQFPYANTSVPQFFRNASYNQNYPLNHAPLNQGFDPFMGFDNNGTMPTQEQLQIHTSEIMRNAMLRKQYQNQNERHFPK